MVEVAQATAGDDDRQRRLAGDQRAQRAELARDAVHQVQHHGIGPFGGLVQVGQRPVVHPQAFGRQRVAPGGRARPVVGGEADAVGR